MAKETSPNLSKPRLGISACLLGQKVRCDGARRQDPFLTDTFGRFVEWVAVCPEAELGMGVPRETMRGVSTPENPPMLAERSGKDCTTAIGFYAALLTQKLVGLKLSGYVFRKDFPSCGLERVCVYDSNHTPARGRGGLLAQAIRKKTSLLPVEDENRLNDPGLRENFVERVFAYHRWQQVLASPKSAATLVSFHTRHKFLLLAHSERHYRRLGRLVAEMKKCSLRAVYEEYGHGFMEALAIRASVKKHANVLEHMLGYFSEHLSGAERKELVELIRDYRNEIVPLIVPVTLFQHYVKKYRVPYLSDQIYLAPSPKELMLRDHAERGQL